MCKHPHELDAGGWGRLAKLESSASGIGCNPHGNDSAAGCFEVKGLRRADGKKPRGNGRACVVETTLAWTTCLSRVGCDSRDIRVLLARS
eukprot:5159198-Pleurochrysis_carterae.AAC.1